MGENVGQKALETIGKDIRSTKTILKVVRIC